MATKLVIDPADANNETTKYSYNYADGEVTTSRVKSLVTALITNGSIFEKVPVAAKSAKLVVTTETEVDITE